MDFMEAIQVLAQEDFDQECPNGNHNRRPKTIFRFMSCDTVCSKCIHDEKAAIRVVKHKGRDSVWLDDISKFFDCSRIRSHNIPENESFVIHLREKHIEDNVCEADNFCSLACKLDHVRNQYRVKKKKRTGGRKRGQMSIFHSFYRLFLLNRKPRSRGRRRRLYVNQVEGRLLPPKKRHRGAE